MKKTFIEHIGNNDLNIQLYSPYEFGTYSRCILEYAKAYISNENINISVDSKVRNEILFQLINSSLIVVFVNQMKNNKSSNETHYNFDFDPCILINNLYEDCAYELFNNENNFFNTAISIEERKIVLLGFLNYVTKMNGFDRIFALKDLYDRAQKKEYIFEFNMLKEFLLNTEKYMKKFKKGEIIEDIINKQLAKWNLNLEDITIESLKENKLVDDFLSLIIYSYEKTNFKNKKEIQNEVIKQKRLEMLKRD